MTAWSTWPRPWLTATTVTVTSWPAVAVVSSALTDTTARSRPAAAAWAAPDSSRGSEAPARARATTRRLRLRRPGLCVRCSVDMDGHRVALHRRADHGLATGGAGGGDGGGAG